MAQPGAIAYDHSELTAIYVTSYTALARPDEVLYLISQKVEPVMLHVPQCSI